MEPTIKLCQLAIEAWLLWRVSLWKGEQAGSSWHESILTYASWSESTKIPWTLAVGWLKLIRYICPIMEGYPWEHPESPACQPRFLQRHPPKPRQSQAPQQQSKKTNRIPIYRSMGLVYWPTLAWCFWYTIHGPYGIHNNKQRVGSKSPPVTPRGLTAA